MTAGVVRAQTPCAVAGGSSTVSLPQYSGSISPDALSTGTEGNFLYVMTQWGFARGNLSNPANPAAFSLKNIGREPGTNNGGVIPLTSDCHQGASIFDIAEAPDGSSRMISDFLPSCADPAALHGELAKTDGGGPTDFGQQIAVDPVPSASKIAAIYLAPPLGSGRYIGYFPTQSFGVQFFDLTSPTGSISPAAGIPSFGAIPWAGVTALRAARVTLPGFDKFLLAGRTSDGRMRVAEVSGATGVAGEVTSLPGAGFSYSLFWAVVNNRAFLFSAELSGGLKVYEYLTSSSTLVLGASIAGNFDRVVVRGTPTLPFPALLAHNTVTIGPPESYIEIYDTRFLTQGGQPLLAARLRQAGSPQFFYFNSFDATVRTNGPLVTAYLYRLRYNGPGEQAVQADQFDISCIAVDPSAPPIAYANATNVSAQSRTGGEQNINYYGDKWILQDASSSFQPITQVQWDFNYTGTFAADRSGTTAQVGTINPAYFPCEPVNGGNIDTGGLGSSSCRQSLGLANPPGNGSYRFASRSQNVNGLSLPFVSNPVAVVAPQAVVAGLSGGVLRILIGGSADASGSKGNKAEATFSWIFTPGGPATGQIVAVPASATAFSLTIAYPGGYTATAAGTVQQLGLIPDFLLAPNPVVRGDPLTLTNLMLKVAAATLNSVDDLIDGALADPASWPTSLPSSFLPVGGIATVTAPGTPGSYYVHLRYNYSVSGISQTPLTVTKPVTVSDQMTVTLSGPASGVIGTPVTFTASVTGGSGTPAYSWNWGDNPFLFESGPPPKSHTYTTSGTYAVAVSATDGLLMASAIRNITISTSAPAPLNFYTLTPCRLIDTRGAPGPVGGPALDANATRVFPVASSCGVPATAKAVSLNVTVTQPTLAGDLRLYPDGAVLPLSSTINYRGGQTRANNAILGLGVLGGLAVRCDQPAETTHLIVDVNGYFQ